MQVAIALRGLHARRGRRAAPGDGAQAQPRAHGRDLPEAHRRDEAERHRAKTSRCGFTTRSMPSRTTASPSRTRRASRCSSTRRRISSTTTRRSSRRRSSTRSRWGSTRRDAHRGREAAWRARCCRSTSGSRGGIIAPATQGDCDSGRGHGAACVRMLQLSPIPPLQARLRLVNGLGPKRRRSSRPRAPRDRSRRSRTSCGARGSTGARYGISPMAGAFDGFLAAGARPARSGARRSGTCSTPRAATRDRLRHRGRRAAARARERNRGRQNRRAAAAENQAAGNVPRRADRSRLPHDRRLAQRPSHARICGRCMAPNGVLSRGGRSRNARATANASPSRGS